MRYFLDAWLEQTEPCLRIVNANTGETYKAWQGEQVSQLIDDGVIEMSDITSCDKEACAECIHNLLNCTLTPAVINLLAANAPFFGKRHYV